MTAPGKIQPSAWKKTQESPWPVCSTCRTDCRWSPWAGFTCWTTGCDGLPMAPAVVRIPVQRPEVDEQVDELAGEPVEDDRPGDRRRGPRSTADPTVLAWLRGHPGGATARQIAEAHTDLSLRTVQNVLARLTERGQIAREQWTYAAARVNA